MTEWSHGGHMRSKESIVGKVVSSWEDYRMDYNYYYATYFSEETKSFVEIQTDHRVWVDAPEDLVALYKEFLEERSRQARIRNIKCDPNGNVSIGHRVKVVRGRKVPKGLVGKVVWKGVDNYKPRYYTTHYRVGIEVEGKIHYTAASNIEILIKGVDYND